MAETIKPSPGFLEKVISLSHAIQTGIMHYFHLRPDASQPKHLRVGIYTAKAEHYGLARLLMEKGVITVEEYEAAILRSLEEEKERYEQDLTELMGGKTRIKLG